jgi:hypothetical protein
MGAANYNGRRAANAVLQASGSHEPLAQAAGRYRPPEWESFKQIDEQRYKQGQPNIFDTDPALSQLSGVPNTKGKLGIHLP